MKRLFYSLISVVIACMAVFSCKRAELEPEGLVDGVLYSFTAEFPEVLDENGKAFIDMSSPSATSFPTSWESGDKIRVFNGTGYADFTYDGTSSFTNETGLPYDAQYGFAMVYPSTLAGETQTTTGGNINLTLTLGESQTYAENKCQGMPLVAYAAQGSFNAVYFKHLCGYIGFSVTGDSYKGNYSAVKLEATGLCGDIALSFSGTPGDSFAPSYTKPSGSKTITLNGWSTEIGTTDGQMKYYMYVPVGTYTDASVLVDYASGNDVGRSVPANPGLAIERGKCRSASAYFQTLFSGGGTDGTAGSSDAKPYLIKNQADLEELRAKVNADASYSEGKVFMLANDIVMTGTWTTTIGNDKDHPFKGTFDGNSKSITNLTVSTSSTDNPAALFGFVIGGTVKKLTVGTSSTGCYNAASNAAAIVGSLRNGGAVENCTVSSGSVIKVGSNTAAGIVAHVGGSSKCTVSNCTNLGASLSSTATNGQFLGGIVGLVGVESDVKDCSVSGGSLSGYANSGGIVGEFQSSASGSSISGCTVSGTTTITGTNNQIGGIVGEIEGAVSISKCSLTAGSVSGAANVGGIVGQINPGSDAVTLTDCTIGADGSTGPSIVASGNQVAGVAGMVYGNATIDNCDVLSASAIKSTGGNQAGGIVGYAQATTDTSPIACTAVIKNCENKASVSGKAYVGGIVGAVTSEAKVQYCKLLAGEIKTTVTSSIGGIAGRVQNTASIENCEVSGGTLTSNANNLGGICGIVDNATGVKVSDCTVTNGVTITKISGTCVGGIIGRINGDATGCTVSGCTSSTAVSSDQEYAGGIVGVSVSGSTATISSCTHNGGTVTSAGKGYAGGIIGGMMGGGTITNCNNLAGKVSTTAADTCNYAGGIVGYCQNTTSISDCTSKTGVEAKGHSAGGIVGSFNGKSTIKNCKVIADAAVTIQASYHTGGIAGISASSTTDTDGAIFNCRVGSNITVYGNRTGVNNGNLVGGIAGLHRFGTINKCLFEGKAKANGTIGGIVGHIRANSAGLTFKIIACQVKGATITSTYTGNSSKSGGIIGYLAEKNEGETGTGYAYTLYVLNCLVNGCNFEIAYKGDHADVGGIIGFIKNDASGSKTYIQNSCVCLDNATVNYNKAATNMSDKVYWGNIVGSISSNCNCEIHNVVAYTWHPVACSGTTAYFDNLTGNDHHKSIGGAGVIGYYGNEATVTINRAFVGNNYIPPFNARSTIASGATIKNYCTRILGGNINKGPGESGAPDYYGSAITATDGSGKYATDSDTYGWDWPGNTVTGTSFSITPTGTTYYTNSTSKKRVGLVGPLIRNSPTNDEGLPTGATTWYMLNDTESTYYVAGRKLLNKYYYPVPAGIAWPDMFN